MTFPKQTPMTEAQKTDSSVPVSMCGMPRSLATSLLITGVPDAVFCHSGRFVAIARSRDGAMSLLSRLSEKQWQDAFRAGGYEPATANRFISKLREKMAQGLALKQ